MEDRSLLKQPVLLHVNSLLGNETHLGRSHKLAEFLIEARWSTFELIVFGSVPVVAYQFFSEAAPIPTRSWLPATPAFTARRARWRDARRSASRRPRRPSKYRCEPACRRTSCPPYRTAVYPIRGRPARDWCPGDNRLHTFPALLVPHARDYDGWQAGPVATRRMRGWQYGFHQPGNRS
jgi:hypothetical protein